MKGVGWGFGVVVKRDPCTLAELLQIQTNMLSFNRVEVGTFNKLNTIKAVGFNAEELSSSA